MNDDDLRRALDDLVGDLPATGPLPLRTATRVRRRRAAKLAGSGALAVVVLAGGAGLALTAGGGPDRLQPLPPATSAAPSATPSATPSASASSAPSPSAPSPAGPSPSPVATVPSPAAAAPRVVLRGDGLGVVTQPSGSTRALLLEEASADEVRAGLDAALGEAEEGPLVDCGANVVQRRYAGLTVTLDGDVLTGWSASSSAEGAPRTGDGLGVGSTLAEVRGASPGVEVTDGSLGREFTLPGGLSGILDGPGEDAQVTFLSAGNACVFR